MAKPYTTQIFHVSGRLPLGQPSLAGLLRVPAERGGRHPQGLRLQAAVQEPRLLLQGGGTVHIREVDESRNSDELAKFSIRANQF